MKTLVPRDAQAPQVSFTPRGCTDCPVSGAGPNTASSPLPASDISGGCCFRAVSTFFCFSEQFRAPKSPEALIRSLALLSYATHDTPTASSPWTALHPPPCSSSAWLQGTHRHCPAALPSPSTDHRDHYFTTDLLWHSSSPAKAGLDHSAGDSSSFLQWFSHKTISFFQTSHKIRASRSTPICPFGWLKQRWNL